MADGEPNTLGYAAPRRRLRPLFATVVAHVASSYLSAVAFVAAGYLIVPAAMALHPPSAWANLVAVAPLAGPVVPAALLWWERTRGVDGLTAPFVTWLAVYALSLPLTYWLARRRPWPRRRASAGAGEAG